MMITCVCLFLIQDLRNITKVTKVGGKNITNILIVSLTQTEKRLDYSMIQRGLDI